ncbi:MAG: hypothetical protein KH812_01500 [Proteus hauseri]|nr:hypothetical protein [Proteus hauseri]
MEIHFKNLANVLSPNDKKENIYFLLSSKIVNCSNSLSFDDFFIFTEKDKRSGTKIYIDKSIFTKIENELTLTINNYIDSNLKRLDKVNKANNNHKDLFLRDTNNQLKQVVNIHSLNSAKKFISSLISETNSKDLINTIFNKSKNPMINSFFNSAFFSKVQTKSINEIVSNLKNKIIELNVGCNLPYKPKEHDMVLVKLGNGEAASNKYVYESEKKSQIVKHDKKEISSIQCKEMSKIAQSEFEILFNFLNENIKKYHDIIDNYNKCIKFNNINKIFNSIKDGDLLFERIYTALDEIDKNRSIQDYADCYHEFKKTSEELNLFYKNYIKKINDDVLKQDDVTDLVNMTKKIESNTGSLKIDIELLKPFSDSCNNFKNEIINANSSLIKKGEGSACSLITSMEVKTNECKKILSDCIKRKESGILSRIYKFIFPKKHNDAMKSLNEHLNKIEDISRYLSHYDINQNDTFSQSEIIAMVTAKLSETPPRTLLSYLYGENIKWDNFKRSLFN